MVPLAGAPFVVLGGGAVKVAVGGGAVVVFEWGRAQTKLSLWDGASLVGTYRLVLRRGIVVVAVAFGFVARFCGGRVGVPVFAGLGGVAER